MRQENIGPCECCGEPVVTTCCPDDPTPATLFLTLSSACGVFNGVYTLNWTASFGGLWFGVVTINGNTRTWTLQCDVSGNWNLALWQGDSSTIGVSGCGGANMVEADCNPFHLTLSILLFDFLSFCREGCSNVTLTFDLVP